MPVIKGGFTTKKAEDRERVVNAMFSPSQAKKTARTEAPVLETDTVRIPEEGVKGNVTGTQTEDAQAQKETRHNELKALTVKELKAKCKEMGITGYSSLNEEALIALIIKVETNPMVNDEGEEE